MADLLIHYGWGVFATLNPCVLPILPFIILSALNVSRLGPVVLSAGLVTAYGLVGGTLALIFGAAVGQVSEGAVSSLSALLLVAMGSLFLRPKLYAAFTGALGRFSSGVQQAASDVQGSTLRAQFWIGFLLALAWVPCSSPALITASSSAASLEVPFWFTYLRYVFFGLGAITFILVLGLGARTALMARRNLISGWIDHLKPIMGALLVGMGLLILTGGVHWLETQLNASWGLLFSGFDAWLQDQQRAFMGPAEPSLPKIRF